MNKTDRLLAIVLELQGRGRLRAEDLARTFETSKRTIYRDIEALCEAGVPLLSVPGQGYRLMEGYFLPPLSFSTEEATMLLLGSDYMAHNFDAQYRAAAQSASRKIASVLPEQLRDDVYDLQNNIHFITPDAKNTPDQQEMLQKLRRALIDHTTARFTYHARHSRDEHAPPEIREVDPYGLLYSLNSWYMTGYCHLRRDIRHFRLDRMENLELQPKTFKRPRDFKMDHYKQDRMGNIVVRALFDPSITRWVRESRPFYAVGEEETPEGLLITLRIRQESEILPWLLSWGRRVRVLEPEALRQHLAEEARSILTHYQSMEER